MAGPPPGQAGPVAPDRAGPQLRTTAPGTAPGTHGAWPEAAELLAAIGAVRRSTRRAVQQAWPSEPLPTAQGELLRLVAARPGIRVAEAARELRLAANTVSTLVGRLAEAGLLSRERTQPDGRSVRLTVTARARERITQWRDLRAELAGHVLATLDPADREALAGAVPALIRLAERMETR